MVKVEGNIAEQFVSISIDPESTHNYITPRIVEICAFKKLKHRKSWLVQQLKNLLTSAPILKIADSEKCEIKNKKLGKVIGIAMRNTNHDFLCFNFLKAQISTILGVI